MGEQTVVAGAVTEATLGEFKQRFRGQVILPTDDGFEAARKLWNGMIDRFPGVIVRPTGVADVITAVNFARDNGIVLAVRCGGHSASGQSSCDGGMVIDLSAMRSVRVDPVARTANVAGGALLGDVDHETLAFGLATTTGTVSHTGVGGLTLGGGFGRLHRKHGLTVDNLLSVDIVTADGRLVHASEQENAELFWGIRGAGPNFGIVVNFEFKLHPRTPFINASLNAFDPADARDVLAAFRTFTENSPDEVLTIAAFTLASGPPFPPELHGRRVLMIGANHCGTPEEAARDLAPLKEIPGALFHVAMPLPYLMMQKVNDEVFAHGKRYYDKGAYLKALTDDVIDLIAKHADQASGDHAELILFQMGGAFSRVPEDAMAFSGRGAPFFVNTLAAWTDPAEDDTHRTWVRAGMDVLAPFLMTTNYVNAAEEGDVRAIYGDAKYERLVRLKNEWDPGNLFRLNANIKPTV